MSLSLIPSTWTISVYTMFVCWCQEERPDNERAQQSWSPRKGDCEFNSLIIKQTILIPRDWFHFLRPWRRLRITQKTNVVGANLHLCHNGWIHRSLPIREWSLRNSIELGLNHQFIVGVRSRYQNEPVSNLRRDGMRLHNDSSRQPDLAPQNHSWVCPYLVCTVHVLFSHEYVLAREEAKNEARLVCSTIWIPLRIKGSHLVMTLPPRLNTTTMKSLEWGTFYSRSHYPTNDYEQLAWFKTLEQVTRNMQGSLAQNGLKLRVPRANLHTYWA